MRQRRSEAVAQSMKHAASLGSGSRVGVIPESHFALTRGYDVASEPLRKDQP